MGELLSKNPPKFHRGNHGQIIGEKTTPQGITKKQSHNCQQLFEKPIVELNHSKISSLYFRTNLFFIVNEAKVLFSSFKQPQAVGDSSETYLNIFVNEIAIGDTARVIIWY